MTTPDPIFRIMGEDPEPTVCTCEEGVYDKEHCPYDEELHHLWPDEEPKMCDCCPYCRYQCAMDV